ncbi:MAG: hypothetical protein QM762_12670 [Chryseolinea sp.]
MKLTETDVQNMSNMLMTGQAPPAPAPAAPATPATPADPATSTPPPAPAAAAPPATPPTAPASTPPAPPASTDEPGDVYEEIDLAELGFESMDGLRSHLARMKELETENSRLSEYKAGPKFKSDRHKLLYEFGAEVDGMEFDRARHLISIVGTDLTKMSDQQLRFEHFRIKPENKGFTQEELHTLFQEDDRKLFGDPNDADNPQTETQKIRARNATNQAKEALSQMQSNWKTARTAEPSAEQVAAERADYIQFLEQQTADFGGIQLDLAAEDENGEKFDGEVSFKLSDKQLPAVIQAMADPQEWWESLLREEGIMSEGNKVPDFKKFATLVSFIQNKYEILNSVYRQGREDQKAHGLKSQRNVSDPSKTTPPPPSETVKKSDRQMQNEAAMKAVGLV